MAKAAKHRNAIVETAMRLFRQQGYASSGLQQILKESGAPKGSLYYYFPGGKEEVGEAAVRLAGMKIRLMLEDLAAKHDGPEAFLRAYARQMAAWMAESGFRSGCPLATTLLENAPQSPGITAAGKEATDGWIEVIAAVLARTGATKAAARAKAQNVVAAMEGALILARVRSSKQPILDVAKLV